jgi:uncharacterized protein (TIGR03792 family)
MVIEWLKFRVAPEWQEKFMQKDAEIWTKALADCPGFLDKELWMNPDEPDAIAIAIRWKTRQEWKSIPQDFLEEIERQFAQQMGEGTYVMIEAKEYQVRK